MEDKKQSPIEFIEQLLKTMTLDEVNVYLSNLGKETLRNNPNQDPIIGGKGFWQNAKITRSPAFLESLLGKSREKTSDGSDTNDYRHNESDIITQMRPFPKSACLTFDTLQSSPNTSANDLARMTGLSKSSVYRSIKILLRYEFIESLPDVGGRSPSKFFVPARLEDFKIEHVWLESGAKLLKQKEKRRKEFFKNGGKMVVGNTTTELKLLGRSFDKFEQPDESFDEFFQKYFDLSDDELVAMAKNAPDMGGSMLVELQEFMIRRAERLERENTQNPTPSDDEA
ncbi:MAG: winged helix-turn-helix transcriptional regulator [Limnobacter sp.]|uniref:winged helix-turn-helix transcriptional regulator n=1 Tax=Limnobacter sp. TaxID=2003368 RepID=UPI004037D694